ncbi:hypothetical protein PPYR_07778 [Photinus pyralis]|uniref:Malate dehydrogenase, mitochondrial n=1 Tax=Photinus pyralis TaxID=7054 RepID=A0A5N4ARQ7_PHOPY|nr:uncharacterized protein LOC116169549 [Photinus pyralis]KAB0799898.1 hypothetical protein PPYR_07778 [Photinus pyralis]
MKFPLFRRLCKPNLIVRTKSNPSRCPPDPAPTVVTLIGASSRVGQLTALQLKQCNLLDELRLFEFAKSGLSGVALDLNHIPTSVNVVSYTGLDLLRNAVVGAQVVVICGGEPKKPGIREYDLFLGNADYVRSVALHTAEFNPNAILCITTPPVTAMVPLVSEEYKRAEVYNPKKILGVTTLGVTRANSVIAAYSEQDPSTVLCPVVGGMGATTLVPVLSQTETGPKLPQPAVELLHNQICKSEDEVLTLKYLENSSSCVLSSSFATTRFVTSVLQGLKNKFTGYEFAFVRQTGHIEPFLSYMMSVIKLDNQGVQSLHMPNLNELEAKKLLNAAEVIRQQIHWGASFVTGASFEKRKRPKRIVQDCAIIKIDRQSRIGDLCAKSC